MRRSAVGKRGVSVFAVAAEQGCITRYEIHEVNVDGAVKRDPLDYDLMAAVLVGLPKRSGYNEFASTLATLFSFETGFDEKMGALESQLGTQLAGEFKGDVSTMGDLGDWVMQKGMERGIEKGIAKGMEQGLERGREQGLEQGMKKGIADSLRALMNSMSLTVDQAMKALAIPESDWPTYRSLV